MELFGAITCTALGAGTVGSPFASTMIDDWDFFPINTTMGIAYFGTTISVGTNIAQIDEKAAVQNTMAYIESMSQDELVKFDTLLAEKGFELEFVEPNETSEEKPKVYEKI